MTNLTIPNQVETLNGFKSQIAAKYPKMKIVTILQDQSDSAKAAQQLEALPGAYPSVNAIWIVEGNAPAAVPTALAHAGLKPGKLFVLAIDGLQPTLAAISEGWITETLVQCFFWASPFAARLALAKLAGTGPTQKDWAATLDLVGKAQVKSFKGCPADYGPSSF
jgi:ribose transport system substrate-binding protein